MWYSNLLKFVELGFYQAVAGRPRKVLNVIKDDMTRAMVSNRGDSKHVVQLYL